MIPANRHQREPCYPPVPRVIARIAGHILRGANIQNCSFLNVLAFGVWDRRLAAGAGAIQKTCTTPDCRNWRMFRAISSSRIVLAQFCTWVQLLSPRLRATVERKAKYENVHTIEQALQSSRLAGRGGPASRVSPRVLRNSNLWCENIKNSPNSFNANTGCVSNRWGFSCFSRFRERYAKF